jgi:hypothetical protein
MKQIEMHQVTSPEHFKVPQTTSNVAEYHSPRADVIDIIAE